MTLADELKILDDKIKANQAQYDLGREAARISALSSKYLLEKFKYLTEEDLGHRPRKNLKKLNLSIIHWICHLVNRLKKIMLKILRIERVILIMTASIAFTDFTKSIMNLKRCH